MKRAVFSVLFLLCCSGCTDWEEEYRKAEKRVDSAEKRVDSLNRELRVSEENLSIYKKKYESTKSQLSDVQKRLDDVIAYDKSGIRGLFQQFSFRQLILFSSVFIWLIVAVAVFLWMRKFASCMDIDKVSVNKDGGTVSMDNVAADSEDTSSAEL